jgi:Tol biopolymer transport system component
MGNHLDALKAALTGRYTIIRELGSGGMATVYLADDERHHRKVALKVLRPEIAASLGSERFFREIEVAARLQHPHILPLLDSGRGEHFLYYVMPYVAGESLRERLDREGELPVHDSIKILREVVDALAAAHGEGVVHRDIKPDNVMLSGRHALVTDFGVAKAVSEATGRQQITTAGVALGTPSYMAPEQAVADPHLDHRVDIYAVGVLGYEMLTGHVPFEGRGPQEVLAAHVTQAPLPVTDRRPAVPPALGAVIMKCLEKRPADRWQSAEELLGQLDALATPSAGITPTQTRPVPAHPTRRRFPLWLAWVLGGALVAAGAFALSLNQRSRPLVALGRRTAVATAAEWETWPSLSPDGKMVTYSLRDPINCEIMVQQVDGGAPVRVTGDMEGPQCFGSLSPDGARLLVLGLDGLYVLPTLGGQARPVVSGNGGTGGIRWGTWSPDGKGIAYVRNDSLIVQGLEGSERTTLATADDIHSPAWSPDGKWIAYVEGNMPFHANGNIAPSAIRLIPAGGGTPISVTDATALNTSPIWVPGEASLLFISDREGGRDIYQVFLKKSGSPDGEPHRITTGLNPERIGLSADGKRLTWSVMTETANIWTLPIPARDSVPFSRARQVTQGTQNIENLDVSPDGAWLYYDSDRNGNSDIWRQPIAGGTPQQVTTDPAPDFDPTVSPDGNEVAFHRNLNGDREIFIAPVNGGSEFRLTTRRGDDRGPLWSSDGTSLIWIDLFTGIVWFADRTNGSWGAPRPVSNSRLASLSNPVWSSRGRAFIVVTAAGLTEVDLNTGAAQPIAPRFDGVFLDQDVRHHSGRAARSVEDPDVIYGMGLNQSRQVVVEAVSLKTGKHRVIAYPDNPLLQGWRLGFAVGNGNLYFPLIERKADVWIAELGRN